MLRDKLCHTIQNLIKTEFFRFGLTDERKNDSRIHPAVHRISHGKRRVVLQQSPDYAASIVWPRNQGNKQETRNKKQETKQQTMSKGIWIGLWMTSRFELSALLLC